MVKITKIVTLLTYVVVYYNVHNNMCVGSISRASAS